MPGFKRIVRFHLETQNFHKRGCHAVREPKQPLEDTVCLGRQRPR